LILIDRTRAAAWSLAFALVFLTGNAWSAAQDAPDDPLVQMIVDLVSDADRDMRALGLQQVREEVPGEAATKRFTKLLADLSPEGQAGLLEALGDRHDTTALPAILEMLKSENETVRAAALGALGSLGSVEEIPLLAGKAAGESKLEKDAARLSLIQLRGEKVNAGIVAAMAGAEANVQAALLGVLAARNAKEALSTVLEKAEAPDTAVRLAAIRALRFLADESQTAAVVKILTGAKDDTQRSQAELALLTIAGRGGPACAAPIAAGLADADATARVALLRGLARAGGPEALQTVLARVDDDDESVRDQAVRVLSGWSDPAVAGHLLEIAKKDESLRHQVLAIRGLVRLASPLGDRPGDPTMLAEVAKLAKRANEKRLLLGALGGQPTPPALALAVPLLDDPAVAEEAALAAVSIAEKIQPAEKDQVRAAMEKVGKAAKTAEIRQRAEKVLASL
jgi:HEAT repeat protein